MKESGGLLDKKITFQEKVKLIIHKWPLHLMMLPFVLYFIIFEIFPMVGVWIAFTDYNPYQGVFGSPFVGFDNFERFFKVYNFWQLILNTFSLSVVGLIAGLFSSFVFALLLNEIQSVKYKRVVQICSYLPNFISVVVIAGMCFTFLNPDRGIINKIIVLFGGEATDFMS